MSLGRDAHGKSGKKETRKNSESDREKNRPRHPSSDRSSRDCPYVNALPQLGGACVLPASLPRLRLRRPRKRRVTESHSHTRVRPFHHRTLFVDSCSCVSRSGRSRARVLFQNVPSSSSPSDSSSSPSSSSLISCVCVGKSVGLSSAPCGYPRMPQCGWVGG